MNLPHERNANEKTSRRDLSFNHQMEKDQSLKLWADRDGVGGVAEGAGRGWARVRVGTGSGLPLGRASGTTAALALPLTQRAQLQAGILQINR